MKKEGEEGGEDEHCAHKKLTQCAYLSHIPGALSCAVTRTAHATARSVQLLFVTVLQIYCHILYTMAIFNGETLPFKTP